MIQDLSHLASSKRSENLQGSELKKLPRMPLALSFMFLVINNHIYLGVVNMLLMHLFYAQDLV